MCGIVGIIGHAISEESLGRAVASLQHRGPDESGLFIDRENPVALGHARLSIIDLATGAQPLYSEDEDIVLVCNGEIYDFERLREELIGLGHRFKTGSDAEVIIHLYQQYGLSFTEHLRGEFAFLLYDRRKGKLLAVRDRFGIKPLFFNRRDGGFLFGSEAKALFATGLLQPAIDVHAVRDIFSLVIPDSAFEGVEVVPPGCLLIADPHDGSHEIRCYWDCDLPLENDDADVTDFDSCVAMVREKFDEAIRLRLRADVPVGVYLSGGIDSAIVAATVAKYHPGKLKAFNISFPHNEAFDEDRLAQEMAAHVGAEFHSVKCTPEALLENAEECIRATELPFSNFHGVGKFMLSRLAREHVKVVITGEGADEVFLGYVIFQPGKGTQIDQMLNKKSDQGAQDGDAAAEIEKTLGFVPMPDHEMLMAAKMQKRILGFFHRKHRRKLSERSPLQKLRKRMDPEQTKGRPLARQRQYAWIKNMLAPYLLTILGDRVELGHSLEGRTPFLDHHLFEAARHVPDRFKIHQGVEKYVLREAFRGRITEAIQERKKWPYSAPPLFIEKGRYAVLDDLIERYLSRNAVRTSGIFSYWRIRLWQLILRLLPADSLLKARMNSAMALILTVQILDHQFVQAAKESPQQTG